MTREPHETRVSKILFLHEQIGVPELLLKNRISDLFKHHAEVQRAYLAQIEADGCLGVALCIRCSCSPDRSLVEKIGPIFAAVFNAREHLDIIFLNEEQETEIVDVCLPFFAVQVS